MAQFFKQWKEWKQFKKSDWVLLALAGVLLLVIALPEGGRKAAGFSAGNVQAPVTEERQAAGEMDYAAYLEEKLSRTLGKMDGVGKVAVMVTVSDAGERVLEKNTSRAKSELTETDGGGGSRKSSDVKEETTTVYMKSGNEESPYVQREKLPAVEGVVVVAEGGGNPGVVSDISEAVQALLPVKAHRIKVVKMESREE